MWLISNSEIHVSGAKSILSAPFEKTLVKNPLQNRKNKSISNWRLAAITIIIGELQGRVNLMSFF
jgi:hypothetical protein